MTEHPVAQEIAPAMPVKHCGACRNLSLGLDAGSVGHRGLAYAVSLAESKLAAAWAADTAAHAENEPAIAHNKAMRERITALMKAAGIPDSYMAPKPGSRSWRPKSIRMDAGYLGDLKRTFPITDGFDQAKSAYETLTARIAAAKAQVEAEKGERERQAEQTRTARRADLALATIILRYKLPVDTDWPDALDTLRRRDKYLDLAIAGAQTRGDWSEGFWRVEDALGRFTIKTDRDKDIAADLCGCLRSAADCGGDGRIFRGTTWSYDQLFALVEDKQLLADAQTCMEHIR